ncbi:valine--tRNA ligase [Methylobacterium sp. 17Sr1-1]|uniref:valine--tRNA ligase n=1 Tax=Methylobacterium sp. 17Sr1-1 TaxID=2202826 RepID=UPI000D704456|nr:valine--tRNA ligase [Methylobacterium sp. 17Sr1-1]AWN54495.1 valine--tRNA ligase [Methylobacterium sp. 17Sr1-1]
MMDKTFDPAAVEARIAAEWEEAQAFRAGRPDRAGAEPYSIMIPPPNVTGSLHMGHALNNTLQDVLARFERLRGKDVLWQPGTDHAGIATQMVVERRLAEQQQPDRRSLGRAEFVRRVWEWKAESGGTIVNQLKRLGASCDWSRERFTMDEGLSKAVLKVFVDLHAQGLIYRDKRLVNWDPKFQTAISDLEVQQVEVKGHLWHFAYPVVDEAGNETGETITVATTRPETMLGDTAVAVHPEDERYRALVGKSLRLPLVGRLIRIVADEYSDPEKGTGAVKITPAHDFNDFEVGRRHGLSQINILDEEARISLEGNADFLEGSSPEPEALALHGLDRFEARKRVVALMEERGRLVTIEPNTHAVPHGDRSGVVIEPYLTDQWYVNVKPLAERAMQAVRDGRTRFVPETYEKTYFQWLENIEPWCISRQLWWGHQIPAWYDADGHCFVAQTEEEALAQAAAKHGRPVSLRRDEDVLDTWFSSGLWPFSTLGWPDETPELARYYPTSALVTGFDIIFFWVARMMMLGLHALDEVPFRTVYIHALVRDEKGAKMSKSKGNVVDPLDLVDRYGADALRFTLAAMAAQGRDIKLSVQRVEGYRNFATKLWNAARFAEMNGCRLDPAFRPEGVTQTLNAWALGEAARAVAEVTGAIEAYRFNDAANAAYRFVWNVFCDWYLELAKPVLQGEDGAAKEETRRSIATLIDQICVLLHPFMPFLTEELWATKAREAGVERGLLALAAWPDLGALAKPEAEAEIGWVVDLVSEIRSARSETNVPAGAQIPLVLVSPSQAVRERVSRWGDTVRRLGRIASIDVADASPRNAVQLIVRGEVAALPLEGVVDLTAEVARLTKEDAKLGGEVGKIDAKLGNADFLARAPEEVVEEQRERREAAIARREKVREALARLQG